MGLFEGISDVPGVSDDALCSLGGAVIAKLHTLPFPRSLCELRPDEEDYRRLCVVRKAPIMAPGKVADWHKLPESCVGVGRRGFLVC